MKTEVKNGSPAAKSAGNQADTSKGVAALAVVKKATSNPYAEKVEKIAAVQRKVIQLQNLRDVETMLHKFKVSRGEDGDDSIQLRDGAGHRYETGNPILVGKVINFLQAEVAARIPEVEQEILAAAI